MIDVADAIEPSGRDLFIAALISKKTMPWLRYTVWIAVLSLVFLPWILSAFEGTFLNNRLNYDAIHDLGYIAEYILFLPFLMWFSRYYLGGIGKACKTLYDSNVVIASEEEQTKFVTTANEYFAKHEVTFLPYLVALLPTAYVVVTYLLGQHNGWNSPVPPSSISLAAILSFVPTFIFFSLLLTYVARVVVVYFVVRRLLLGELHIQPLHPDHCGGMAPLGEFSLRVTKAGIVVGFICLLGIDANMSLNSYPLIHHTNVAIIGGYVVGLAILFFLPLLPARTAMCQARDRVLTEISCHFQILLQESVQAISATKDAENSDMERLEHIQKLYSIASSMPVYPFNIGNVTRFFGSVIWPVIFMLIQALIKNI